MNRELIWKQVYGAIKMVADLWPEEPPRRGHPDIYATWQVVAWWLWTALWNQPISTTCTQLPKWRIRQGFRQAGYDLPPRAPPHEGTLGRRACRLDFWQFLQALNDLLIGPTGTDETLILDSSPLPVGRFSGDPEATWGHHGLHGYRWHVLLRARDTAIVEQDAQGAHVHDLTVAPQLITAAGARGLRARFVPADIGYDSEPLHRCVQEQLHGLLVAPLNDRGGTRAMRKTPLRKALWQHWRSPPVRHVRRQRYRVEQAFGTDKTILDLESLPSFVRHRHTVRRWMSLKTVLHHGHLAYLAAKRME